MTELLYFAYGSNMDRDQMLERCPDAKIIGSAYLPNYELSFPRFSRNRGCAVASIESASDKNLWGVLFELTPRDVFNLNKNEGYKKGREASKNSYNKIPVTVYCYGTDADRAISAFTYIAVPQEGFDGKPNR